MSDAAPSELPLAGLGAATDLLSREPYRGLPPGTDPNSFVNPQPYRGLPPGTDPRSLYKPISAKDDGKSAIQQAVAQEWRAAGYPEPAVQGIQDVLHTLDKQVEKLRHAA